MSSTRAAILAQDARIAVQQGRRAPRGLLLPDERKAWDAAYMQARDARARAASGLRVPLCSAADVYRARRRREEELVSHD